MVFAPACTSAARASRIAAVPTRLTVTASMPWPMLAMSNRILSPAVISAVDETLILVAPAAASAARKAWRPGLPTFVTVAISNFSRLLETAG